MNTYIFTINTQEEGIKAVVQFAYTLIAATQLMLDFEGIKEWAILGVIIQAA